MKVPKNSSALKCKYQQTNISYITDNFENGQLHVSGWGRQLKSKYSKKAALMTATVTGASIKECSDGGLPDITEEMHLCVRDDEQDACQGDSGG